MIIRKLFKAEIAHRVKNAYTESCRGLHGHSYIFEVFLQGKSQDNAQMLIDFSLIKEKFKKYLDAFDHSLLIWNEDKPLMDVAEILNPRRIIVPYNPTAEQMSRHIYYLGLSLKLPMHKVIVHETQTGFAEFSGDDDIRIELEKVEYSEAIKKDWK